MNGFRRVAVAAACAVGLLTVSPSGLTAQTLPAQAPAVANEHTHGPDGVELDRRGRPVPGAPYAVDDAAPWSTADYDGLAPTTDQDDGDLRRGLPMFHAVYVYPSDMTSYPSTRFATFAAMFQADARDASALLGTLYGRAIRFDERQSGNRSMLDITVFKSKHNSKQLAGARQFNMVNDELLASGKFSAPNKKYVVWLDAGSKYCGQGHLAQDRDRDATNLNEGRTLAIVYRPYAMGDTKTGGFCRGRTLRHELGHTMGALQSVAPHAYDGAHCNDSAEDTMCYVSATSRDTGAPDFDFNNDDYWDPLANPTHGAYPATAPLGKLSWWTVNLSKFLCDAPTACDTAAAAAPY